MNNSVKTIPALTVNYYDQEFTLVTLNSGIRYDDMLKIVKYVQEIGDIAFIANSELYISPTGMFHVEMKYCDKYHFIQGVK